VMVKLISIMVRYIVLKKLGWGHFSTVWMVRDRKYSNKDEKKYLALKVQKSADHYTEAAMDEVELLDCIAKERNRCKSALSTNKDAVDSEGLTLQQLHDFSRHTATLHDSFFHTGKNGRHMCMVFEMLGCNLLSVIKASFNLETSKLRVEKLALSLVYEIFFSSC